MPLFARPVPKLGTRFYDGKNRKLVYILTEPKTTASMARLRTAPPPNTSSGRSRSGKI